MSVGHWGNSDLLTINLEAGAGSDKLHDLATERYEIAVERRVVLLAATAQSAMCLN